MEETDPGTNDQIDAAYREKYRRYTASIVDSIVSPQTRATTPVTREGYDPFSD